MKSDLTERRTRPFHIGSFACIGAKRWWGSGALALILWAAVAAGEAGYQVCLDVTEDVRALGSDDLFESEPAAERLGALGAAAWPALIRALEAEDTPVREGIVGVLATSSGAGADDAVVRALGRAARGDPEVAVRVAALSALRRVAGAKGYEAVRTALDDPDPTVRREAITACKGICRSADALGRLVALALADEPLPNALQARRVLWSLTSEGADEEIVARIREQGRAALRARAGGSEAAPERRELLAALLLAELDDTSALDVVARATRAGETALRVHALHALGRLGDASHVPLLAEWLHDEDPTLALYAYDALRRMSERGIAAADPVAVTYGGPRPQNLLPRP